MKYVATVNGKSFSIEINDDHTITVDGQVYPVDFLNINREVCTLLIGGHSYEAYLQPGEGDQWQVLLRGMLYEVTVEDERENRLRAAAGSGATHGGEFSLKAPMPGLVVAVPVTEGQTVKKGDNLVILESMKMQNELKSPRAGTVMRVNVRAGQSVEQNQVMVTLS
jgi:biotin carboxyl carrier protein